MFLPLVGRTANDSLRKNRRLDEQYLSLNYVFDVWNLLRTGEGELLSRSLERNMRRLPTLKPECLIRQDGSTPLRLAFNR